MKKCFFMFFISALILCLCASCTSIHLPLNKTDEPSQRIFDTDDVDVALTIGSHKISAAEYGYMYLMQYYNLINMAQQSEQMYGYNMYGFDYTMSPEEQDSMYKDDNGETIRWDNQLKQTTVDYFQQFYTLYDLALSNNYKLTDEEQASIDEQIKSQRENASAASSDNKTESKSLDEYLEDQFGEGINEEYLRGLMEKEIIVQRFADEKEQSFRDQYTDEKVDQIYRENRNDYDVVDLEIRSQDDTEPKSGSYSFSDVSSGVSDEAAAWAFDNSRKAGDKKQFQTEENTVYDLTVLKPAHPQETVDVRHILFATIDLDTRQPLTESEIAAKKAEAEKVLAQWKTLKNQTSEEFGKLAEQYTEDTGSKDNGGLYEKATPGQMVDSFDAWIFDERRKEGDVDIIESEYGYHVMYYVGNKNYAYRDSIRTENTQNEYSSWLEGELAKGSAKVTERSVGMEKGYAIAKQRIDNTVEQIRQYNNSN